MKNQKENATRADRRARIEEALAEYPHVNRETLAEILDWFNKEASALDVGLIASDPKFREPYKKLKGDHLDRIRGADLFWIVVGILVSGIAVALTVWAII